MHHARLGSFFGILRDKGAYLFRFVFVVVHLTALSVLAFPMSIRIARLRKRGRYQEANTIAFPACLNLSAQLLRGAGVCENITGQHNIPKGPVVIVANHQTIFDSAVYFVSAQRSVSFLAKQQLFHIPVMGYWLKISDCLPLKRNNLREDRRVIDKASQQTVDQEKAMLVYPEGTRNHQPEQGFLPFRPGSLRVAFSCGIPVVPMVGDGGFGIGQSEYKRANGRWDLNVSVMPVRQTKHIHTAAKRREFVQQLAEDMQREWQTIRVRPTAELDVVAKTSKLA